MKRIKLQKKQLVTSIIVVGIVLIAVVSYVVFLSKPNEPQDVAVTSPQTIPLVQDDENAQSILIDKFTNRQPLSLSDQAAKTRILTLLPTDEQTERIYQGTDFAVDYVRSADLFQVEIDTTNIDMAKEEGNTWFLEHRMSQQGICNLPVQFYLSYEMMNQLQGTNTVFNTLAPGCY